jgi:hypothetical protein
MGSRPNHILATLFIPKGVNADYADSVLAAMSCASGMARAAPPMDKAMRLSSPICWHKSRRMRQSAVLVGDGAYDTKKCHAAIAERDAGAVIPVRRNGRPWKEDGPGAAARNETLRAIKRLGRTIWKKWRDYHRRSLVETKMHCFKLLGQRVMARTFDRQITKLKGRAAILNRFSKIGTPNTLLVA